MNTNRQVEGQREGSVGAARDRRDGADREALRMRRRSLVSSIEPQLASGRVASLRASSGAVFADVHAMGALMQICALRSSEAFASLRSAHLGDWVEASGSWGETQSGDRALFAESASVLARCEPGFPTWDAPLSEQAARSMPDWARASDPVRMARASARFSAIEALRDWARRAGLREAITPILCAQPSGALAEPFWTHSSGAGRDLALRVAPENALVRLVLSGFPALYEIGPSFRNEGMSWRHHPEFLMMEAYRVGWSMRAAMAASMEAIDSAWVALGGARLDPWRELGIEEALVEFGCPGQRVGDADWLAERVGASGHAAPAGASLDALRWLALEEVFEPPSFPCAVVGHPEESSPLAAPDPSRPGASLRFELYVGGIEVANGYEQLRDASLQATRFEAQAARAGDGREAMGQDESYLAAMRLGMPVVGGFGVGIDRLAQLAGGCSIREALAFPLSGG